MHEWVLIIAIFRSGYTSTSISNVPGFSTRAKCLTAGDDIRAQIHPSDSYFIITTACVEK